MMNLLQLIAKLLMGQTATDQNRRDAGLSVLPQAGGIQSTGQMLDLRRQMMEAYRLGDYDRAAKLQDMIAQMQVPQTAGTSQAGMY